MIVPRTDTGILAEKAKACWGNLVQGTRQIRGVCSLEALPAVLNLEFAKRSKRGGTAGRSDKEEATV